MLFEDEHAAVVAERQSASAVRVVRTRRPSRATVLLAVSGAGEKLPLLVICKGKIGGKIGRQFDLYTGGAVYAVQHNAWVGSLVPCEVFVAGVWRSYIDRAQPGSLVLYVETSGATHLTSRSSASQTSALSGAPPLEDNCCATAIGCRRDGTL